jgi:phosphohistidine phosphatase
MKLLYILRHAKAVQGTKDISDKARPLNERGIEACAKVGTYLKEHHKLPALVLCSPSIRTQQTETLVKEAAGGKWKLQMMEKLYLAGAEEIIRQVQKVEDDINSVMVIGHNPGMHHAAHLLARPDDSDHWDALTLKYPTGALAVLRFDIIHWVDMREGQGELIDFMTPGALD